MRVGTTLAIVIIIVLVIAAIIGVAYYAYKQRASTTAGSTGGTTAGSTGGTTAGSTGGSTAGTAVPQVLDGQTIPSLGATSLTPSSSLEEGVEYVIRTASGKYINVPYALDAYSIQPVMITDASAATAWTLYPGAYGTGLFNAQRKLFFSAQQSGELLINNNRPYDTWEGFAIERVGDSSRFTIRSKIFNRYISEDGDKLMANTVTPTLACWFEFYPKI